MNFLVSAGSTQAPIDKARSVTTSLPIKIGSLLAQTAAARGHKVTLLSSDPDRAGEGGEGITVVSYRTFDDIATQLQQLVKGGEFDTLFLAAAVGDYISAGVYTAETGTTFNARTRQWESRVPAPTMLDHKPGLSDVTEPEVWVRMVRSPKLVDRVRSQWNYKGLLVKFKTASGIGDQELVEAAEKSRLKSSADMIVVNTWEAAHLWAYFGPVDGRYDRVTRRELAERVVLSVEHVARQARSSAEFRLPSAE
ncbi:MAG TPA: phosphopantothenoylcysteine decarboxylase [Fimbriiglobus sp.]|jgi:phosphopantothenoylcysteine synthetase/decarboxylase